MENTVCKPSAAACFACQNKGLRNIYCLFN